MPSNKSLTHSSAGTDLYIPEDKCNDPYPPYSIYAPGPANLTKEVTRMLLYSKLHSSAVMGWIQVWIEGPHFSWHIDIETLPRSDPSSTGQLC